MKVEVTTCVYQTGVMAAHSHLPWLLSKTRALPLDTMT